MKQPESCTAAIKLKVDGCRWGLAKTPKYSTPGFKMPYNKYQKIIYESYIIMYGLYMIENMSQIFTNYVLFFFLSTTSVMWCQNERTAQRLYQQTYKTWSSKGVLHHSMDKILTWQPKQPSWTLSPPATASAKICSSGTVIALSNTKKEWEHFSEHKNADRWSFMKFWHFCVGDWFDFFR